MAPAAGSWANEISNHAGGIQVSRSIASVLTLILAATSGAGASQAQDKAPLAVTVTGLHSSSGQLIACLWKDRKGFPSCQKSPSARRLVLPVDGTTMHFAFPDVPRGSYAVTVHHDENGDGRMQRNFIGMPKEGVGISNNPGGMPGFAKSLIDVGTEGRITIRMRYLFD
ncbi:MAG: DUF2141 domain-containing protein [Novosphingobium sp.]|nr:DUF2141 domain-containing protein [Novosphingobium sp.]